MNGGDKILGYMILVLLALALVFTAYYYGVDNRQAYAPQYRYAKTKQTPRTPRFKPALKYIEDDEDLSYIVNYIAGLCYVTGNKTPEHPTFSTTVAGANWCLQEAIIQLHNNY